jgi:hypothetical protein
LALKVSSLIDCLTLSLILENEDRNNCTCYGNNTELEQRFRRLQLNQPWHRVTKEEKKNGNTPKEKSGEYQDYPMPPDYFS